MTRGTYGANNHEKQFITTWAEQRLTEYARDRAIDAAVAPFDPILPEAHRAWRMGRNTVRGTRWMRDGIKLVGDRDETDKPTTQIGGELFHSIKDRQIAIMQISTGFRSLVNDLAVWHAANPDAPGAAASAQWIAADVTPTLEEWRAFLKHENKSWWTKAATKWDTFSDWHDRLKRLRGLARAHGITLESREPADLQTTIWERGEEGKGSEGAAILGVLKVAVAASLGVVGFVTLYAVVRELHAPRTILEIAPALPTK